MESDSRVLPGLSPAAVAITGHYGNLGLIREPGLPRCGFTVRQQGDHPAPFQITDDRAVALVAPPRPVVDPDDRWRDELRRSPPPYEPDQRVVAHRQHQFRQSSLQADSPRRA